MKRFLALALAAVLLVCGCRIGASAEAGELVKVLMTTPGAEVTFDWSEKPEADALDAAVEDSEGVIPENAKFSAGRLTVMAAGTVTCEEEVYDVSFKVWSTLKRTIGLFFRANDSEVWELVSCNQGDVIEGRFQSAGAYAIAVGW